ncbi:hypothetical protein WJ24_11675 [Burkholderia vietnamiensis]|nr:hypothetical protein WJ24_11675 [Burkholderia vietnamiensis]
MLAHVFLFELNLPRVAAAVVAGGSLGIAGALFQSLTRNPLASPDLLGVTGGAQLGLLAAMLVPALAGVASVPLLFACGLLAAACAIAAAGGWRATPLRLVLAGSVCMLLFAALSTLVLAFFEQNIADAALWANGSLYQPGASGLALAVRWLVAPLVALPFVIRPLNPLALGDDAAVGVRAARRARAAVGVLVPLSALAGGALVGRARGPRSGRTHADRPAHAGPEVLGVTQGAGLVTLFALSTWPLAGQLTLAAAALTGGALSLAITLALNHRHRYAPLAVALTGIAIGALWTTLAQWLITQESVQPARFVVWLVGGTYGRSWGEVAMLLPWCALAVPVFAWLARPLDMLALGDDQAAALGLPVAALRPLALTIATLAACAAVAAVGLVGFVGRRDVG